MKENNNSMESCGLVVAGINRFFDEGYVVWSKKNLEKIFGGNIDSSLLIQWSDLGFIELTGEDERYIKVISPIRDN